MEAAMNLGHDAAGRRPRRLRIAQFLAPPRSPTRSWSAGRCRRRPGCPVRRSRSVDGVGGGLHHDRHWHGTAVEGDHAALATAATTAPDVQLAASRRRSPDPGGTCPPAVRQRGRARLRRIPGQGPWRLRGLLAAAGQGGGPGFASARGPGRRGRSWPAGDAARGATGTRRYRMPPARHRTARASTRHRS